MDTNKLLDGTVEDVKVGLSGLDGAALTALLAAEQAGENRKGVVDAITKAQTAAAAAGDTSNKADDAAGSDRVTLNDERGAINPAVASDLDTSGPADIAPATEFEPSGAPIQTTSIDLEHPAVDANPRANTTENQNRIDFNDPSLDGREVVERALKAG